MASRLFQFALQYLLFGKTFTPVILYVTNTHDHTDWYMFDIPNHVQTSEHNQRRTMPLDAFTLKLPTRNRAVIISK